MWGVMFRLSGGELETDVPGWLLNAAATYTAIDYFRLIDAELKRDPDAYGVDPRNTYSVLLQTWDRALSPVRSLAFGRERVGHEAVGLIPDFYYIHSRGYRDLHAHETPLWRERSPVIGWRGSVTGPGPYTAADEIPRVRLALACRDLALTDVKIFGVHSTMESVFPPDRISAFMAEQGLEGERWWLTHYGTLRHVIDIDGHANAWGLLEKLALGCCVLKVGSPYEQWYYGRMRAWEHYVPVAPDLSDLRERIDWCHAHESACEWIASNGAALARSLTIERELPRSCLQVMAAAHASRG